MNVLRMLSAPPCLRAFVVLPPARHFHTFLKSIIMERNNNREGRIPENNPSKPMDSKREVENSNDGKIDQDFPGYPHYPSREDIMDQRTDIHRVDKDIENLPSGHNATGVSQRFVTAQESGRGRRSDGTEPNRDDVEPGQELDALDTANDEIGTPQNISNEDLDRTTAGTDLLDEIERLDDGTERNRDSNR